MRNKSLKKPRITKRPMADALIGTKHGKLLVLGHVPGLRSPMLCRCYCGKETIILASGIRKSKSCGCSRSENIWKTRRLRGNDKGHTQHDLPDLSGARVGMMTILRLASDEDFIKACINKSRPRNRHWVCQCDCGGIAIRPTYEATKREHCGCRRKYTLERSIAALFTKTKGQATKYGRSFGLSVEQFAKLVCGNCAYCGRCPARKFRHFNFNGIDRIDSSLGYIPENCAASCRTCNVAKGEMSVDEFRAWLKRAYEHLFQDTWNMPMPITNDSQKESVL